MTDTTGAGEETEMALRLQTTGPLFVVLLTGNVPEEIKLFGMDMASPGENDWPASDGTAIPVNTFAADEPCPGLPLGLYPDIPNCPCPGGKVVTGVAPGGYAPACGL